MKEGAAHFLLDLLKSVAYRCSLLEAGAKIGEVVQGHFSLRRTMKAPSEMVHCKALDKIQHPFMRCAGQ